MKQIIIGYMKKVFIFSFLVDMIVSVKRSCRASKKKLKKKIKQLDNKLFKFYTLKYKFPREYKKYSKLPIDESKVVFVEYKQKKLVNSFSILFDELVRNYELNIFTHFSRYTFINRNKCYKNDLALIRNLATSKYIFLSDANLVVNCLKLREGTQVINLWHGCGAFKKFGLSTAELIFGDTRKNSLKYPTYCNNTLVTVSSPEVSWAYEEAMNLPQEKNAVQAIGVSRTDYFYKQDNIDKAYKNLYEIFPQAQGKKIILFAPTFRGRVANGRTATKFSIEMFNEAFNDEYVVICKHHPLAKKVPKIPKEYKDFAVDFTNKMSIDELLCVSDICISDYSSLVFEFSIFERPIIFFAYDLDTYFDWRGFYYDYDELAPGPICKKNSEMIDYIKNIETRFDKQRVKDFKQKFMSSCDGNSTQKIIDYVFGNNLEKYRRENPLEDLEYSQMINSSFDTVKYDAELNKLKKLKIIANDSYNANLNKPVVDNKIVILNNSKNTNVLKEYLKNILQQADCNVLAFNTSQKKEIVQTIASEIATASKIIIFANCTILNQLDIRKETKVICMRKNVLPVTRFAFNSHSYVREFKKDYYDLNPMYKNVDGVVSSSEYADEIYTKSINNSGKFLRGSLVHKYLCDEAEKQNNRDILIEHMPSAEGKKIIFYMRNDKIKSLKIMKRDLMEEFFGDDYIVLFCNNKALKGTSINEFHRHIDSVGLSLIQALSIADVVISNYRSAVFDAISVNKPVFIHDNSYNEKVAYKKFSFDFNEVKIGEKVENIFELAKKVEDIDNFDYSQYNEVKEKYINHYADDFVKDILNFN